MALTVGELVAYIRADGSQFDKTIDDSGKKFSGLGTLITTGTKAVAQAFVGVTTAAVALGVSVFKVGADYNRLQQSSRAALSTLLGGAEAANAQMDKLDDFARNSPFAKQVFITAQQQLLGFGVQADKVLPILDAVQNAVAAVGGNNEQVSQVTYALAQMQGQGKLTGETLNQLGQYGIDAAGILGAEMGKTGAEIRELASKPGGIPVDKIWDPLVEGLMDRFGGATANIKLQMDGALDRVKGARRDIGSAMAAPFIDPKGGGMAVEWVNKVADAMRAAEAKVKPLVDLLVTRFAPGLARVTPALDSVRSAINGWDLSKINGQLDKLTQYGPLIAPVAAALFAFGTQGLPILSTLGITGLNPVVAGLAALIATSPGLQAAGRDFFAALSPLLPVVTALGTTLASSLLGVLDELTPAISDILLAGADLAVVLGDSLGPAAVSLAAALVPVASVAAEVVRIVTDLPTPILLAVTAFLALRSMGAIGAVEGVVKSVGALGTALRGLSIASVGSALLSAFGGPVGIAIAAVTTALTVWMTRTAESKERVRQLTDAIDENTGAWGENAREVAYNMLEAAGAITKAKEAGVDLGDVVTASLDPSSESATRLKERLEELRQAYSDVIEEKGNDSYDARYGQEFQDYSNLLGVLKEIGVVQDEAAMAQEGYADRQRAGASATRDATGATRENTNALQENVDAQREAGEANLSAAEAAARYVDAQDRATAAVQAKTAADAELQRVMEDGNATEEDRATATRNSEQATRDADAALRDQVRSAFTDIDAKKRQNASTGELVESVYAARESFIQQRMAMGDTRTQAAALADSYGLIPSSVATSVELYDYVSGDLATIVKKLQDFNGRTYTAIARVDSQGNTRATYFPGSGLTMSHDGNLLEMMHDGGVRGQKLTPMAPIAQMVSPNSWRVVGDRAVDDEAYIPINHSTRSLAILDETARRLGRVVLPMADGGVTNAREMAPQVAPRLGTPVQITIHAVPGASAADTANEVIRALRVEQRGGRY